MTAQAHILRLFNKASSGLRKFVYRRPDAPPCKDVVLEETSLQGPAQAMQWPNLGDNAAFQCALCEINSENRMRLAQIVGVLPVGFVVQLPVISAILDIRFKTVSEDLSILTHSVGFPIKNLHPGILLKEPLFLCKDCVLVGEQVRRTEIFRRKFKATILKTT